jgi:2'-5' RNA ligase
MLRLFVAIHVPPEVQDALAAEQRRLATAGIAMRWIRPEGIHLTLAFLGNVDEVRISAIEDSMLNAAATGAPFQIEVRGLGAFPPRGAPRVLWAGVAGDLDDLRRLQHHVDGRLRAAGFALEDRPFSPHLTLARAADRSPAAQPALAAGLTAPPRSFGRWEVDDIALVRSDLRPSGSVYTTLFTAPLIGEQGRPTEEEGR